MSNRKKISPKAGHFKLKSQLEFEIDRTILTVLYGYHRFKTEGFIAPYLTQVRERYSEVII